MSLFKEKEWRDSLPSCKKDFVGFNLFVLNKETYIRISYLNWEVRLVVGFLGIGEIAYRFF